ncbi:response regulator [Clostridia bacterium]|nr:response regulator [Clostridia bacterium]
MEDVRIFIVDDSDVARGMLKRILLERKNYAVVGEFASGNGAIMVLDEYAPDILFFELPSADKSNAEYLINQMKQISPETKIVLIAGLSHSAQDMLIHGTAAGADGFIEKPFKKTKIFRMIDELIGQ